MNLTHKLLGSISEHFPFVRTDEESILRLHKDTVRPAADLEEAISKSSGDYRFSKFTVEASQWSFPSVRLSYLDRATCIDSKTRKKLKANRPPPSDPNGYIGILLHMIEPSLWRRFPSEQERCLHQDRVLVHLRGSEGQSEMAAQRNEGGESEARAALPTEGSQRRESVQVDGGR